jgi:hypothetical protein
LIWLQAPGLVARGTTYKWLAHLSGLEEACKTRSLVRAPKEAAMMGSGKPGTVKTRHQLRNISISISK